MRKIMLAALMLSSSFYCAAQKSLSDTIYLRDGTNTVMRSRWDTGPLKYNSKGEITHVKYLDKWIEISGSVHTHPVDESMGMRIFSSDSNIHNAVIITIC